MTIEDKQFKSLQQQVLDFFKDENDDTFIQVVDSFCYGETTKNSKIGALISKFLKENDLEIAFVNYVSDYRSKDGGQRIFRRSSGSDITMIESVKLALMNVAFNRFRNYDHTLNLNKKMRAEHAEMKRLISTLMDAGTTDNYHNTLDEMKDLVISWQR
jgi:hypothetical protein